MKDKGHKKLIDRLIDLRAKRRAVEKAIDALRHLAKEYPKGRLPSGPDEFAIPMKRPQDRLQAKRKDGAS